MRATIFALPLLLSATPLCAQTPVPQIPPAAVDKVANTLDAVTDAIMSLPVGRLQAAIDGRAPTAAEQQMTVRDLEARKDPEFESKLHRHIAEARPMVRQSIRAVNDAIPQMVEGLQQVSRSLQRATANLPDPSYPKR